jgi:hypothetical protein
MHFFAPGLQILTGRTVTHEFVLTSLSVEGDNESYASIQERDFALSDRLDAICDRWAMEGHDLMEAARRPDADQ